MISNQFMLVHKEKLVSQRYKNCFKNTMSFNLVIRNISERQKCWYTRFM